MIDWHEIARTPILSRIADSIRETYAVWIGFFSAGGNVAPIGNSRTTDNRLCEAILKRHDQNGSCHQTVLEWHGKAMAQKSKLACATCHAGLQAIIVPILVEEEVIGSVYISGFLRATEDEASEHALFIRAKELGIASGEVAAGVKTVARLTEREVALLENLANAIALEAASQLGGVVQLSRRAKTEKDYSHITAASKPMFKLFRLLDKVCESDSTVLVTGEAGVGKELIARSVHFNSYRQNGPFVVQNCSALNDSLLDSELFGHKKGSFTGAIQDKRGLFELADGGTFFLDEIGDMTPVLQVKLLRVLQEGTFIPVGDTVVRKVDVRIVAATNRDLRAMIAEGTFRADLFYRLNVITVEVPPLRQRKDDIAPLVHRFLEEKAAEHATGPRTLAESTLEAMVNYDWPGNVRELENEVERLVVLSAEGVPIGSEFLSPRIVAGTKHATANVGTFGAGLPSNLPDALEALERHMIFESLERTGWNKTRAAKDLGISRRNLIRKVDRYNLDDARPTD